MCKFCNYCKKDYAIKHSKKGAKRTRTHFSCSHPNAPASNFIAYENPVKIWEPNIKSQKKWCPLKKAVAGEQHGT